MSNKKFKASQRELARVRALVEPETFREVHRAPVHALRQELISKGVTRRRKFSNVCSARVVVVVSHARRIEASSQVQERPDYSWCNLGMHV